MSVQQNHINQKVESTMQSLDTIQRAEPAPFLLTRLNAAMAKKPAQEPVWAKIGFWLSRPAVSVTIVLAFLLLNMLGIFMKQNNSNDLADTQNAYEYIANVSSNYEIVNITP